MITFFDSLIGMDVRFWAKLDLDMQEMVVVCGGGRGLWGDVQSIRFYGSQGLDLSTLSSSDFLDLQRILLAAL